VFAFLLLSDYNEKFSMVLRIRFIRGNLKINFPIFKNRFLINPKVVLIIDDKLFPNATNDIPA
jgi:hypothetical protein